VIKDEGSTAIGMNVVLEVETYEVKVTVCLDAGSSCFLDGKERAAFGIERSEG